MDKGIYVYFIDILIIKITTSYSSTLFYQEEGQITRGSSLMPVKEILKSEV